MSIFIEVTEVSENQPTSVNVGFIGQFRPAEGDCCLIFLKDDTEILVLENYCAVKKAILLSQQMYKG